MLLSRVAESLYWLGRDIERAKKTARLLDVTYHGRLQPGDGDVFGARNTWEALVTTLGLTQLYMSQYQDYDENGVIEFLTVNPANASSIVSSVSSARENAKGVRDYLSSETWLAINRLYHNVSRTNLHLILADGIYDFCDNVITSAHLIDGTVGSTLLRDEGWQWLRCGTHLERADMLTRIVDSKYHLLMLSPDEVGGPIDRFQWSAVLRSVAGWEEYLRCHAGGVEAETVVEFLLLDERFPRSLRCSIEVLLMALDEATRGADATLRNTPMLRVTEIRNRLRYSSADAILGSGLHEYIFEVQQSLARLSMSLHERFFWLAPRAA
jgi:uncharacterized alpha-E superfamily protein